ncbi:MAG: glycosyltransferase family 2 protein [Candidatus Latescibacteria bacterium]|nr:glycosyltransferase family 2 protein [Candidatus Latescibacterota bacterium]
MNPKTLIIIPAYNEAASIREVILGLKASVPHADVLVVNDGSRDNTSEIARKEGAMVLDLPFNMGIGATVQTGFLFAEQRGYDAAVQVDGDGQHDPADVPALLKELFETEVNVVIGSRYLRRNGYVSTKLRRIGIRFFAFLLFLLTRTYVGDPTSGFRAMDREAIRFFSAGYPSDYPEPEALILLHKKGLKVAEAPVTMRPRSGGSSSIRMARACYYMFKVTLSVGMGMFKRVE